MNVTKTKEHVAPLDTMAPKYGLISKTNNVMKTMEHVAPLDTMAPKYGLISKTNIMKTKEHVVPLGTVALKYGLISKTNNVMMTKEQNKDKPKNIYDNVLGMNIISGKIGDGSQSNLRVGIIKNCDKERKTKLTYTEFSTLCCSLCGRNFNHLMS